MISGLADTLHWPRPLGSPVTESLRPVIENSRDVRTHYEKIEEIASWMAYECSSSESLRPAWPLGQATV
jgi:hypothetical protein